MYLFQSLNMPFSIPIALLSKTLITAVRKIVFNVLGVLV